MANTTAIEWTDATWNPVTGCTKISAGCDHCYAERFSERFRGTPGHPFETGFDLTLRPERLEQPLHWRRSRMIFVNSMSDLFHARVPTMTNPLGVKGAGEAGNVGALPAVANALADALSPLGIRHIEMPATPERLWRAMQGHQR